MTFPHIHMTSLFASYRYGESSYSYDTSWARKVAEIATICDMTSLGSIWQILICTWKNCRIEISIETAPTLFISIWPRSYRYDIVRYLCTASGNTLPLFPARLGVFSASTRLVHSPAEAHLSRSPGTSSGSSNTRRPITTKNHQRLCEEPEQGDLDETTGHLKSDWPHWLHTMDATQVFHRHQVHGINSPLSGRAKRYVAICALTQLPCLSLANHQHLYSINTGHLEGTRSASRCHHANFQVEATDLAH